MTAFASRPSACGADGVRPDFILDERGRGKTSEGRFKLKYKKRDGAWDYKCQGKKSTWADDWEDDELIDADVTDVPVAPPVSVEVGDFKTMGLAPMGYSAKTGKRGKAK